jgi:hypothetical protein
MTLDQAMAKAAAAIDVGLEQARHCFEQSLIDNQCPPEDLEAMLDWNADRLATLRTQTLDQVRAWLLDADGPNDSPDTQGTMTHCPTCRRPLAAATRPEPPPDARDAEAEIARLRAELAQQQARADGLASSLRQS